MSARLINMAMNAVNIRHACLNIVSEWDEFVLVSVQLLTWMISLTRDVDQGPIQHVAIDNVQDDLNVTGHSWPGGVPVAFAVSTGLPLLDAVGLVSCWSNAGSVACGPDAFTSAGLL